MRVLWNMLLGAAVAIGGLSPSFAEAADSSAVDLIRGLSDIAYLEAVGSVVDEQVVQYLVPLGAIQKVRGVWAPRTQERIDGVRNAFTWRVLDGYTSAEVMADLDARFADDASVSTLFSCDARACGASVQWANRIFQQRLLYGQEKSQSYRALDIDDGGKRYRVLLYASARTVDRQYMHAELIALDE